MQQLQDAGILELLPPADVLTYEGAIREAIRRSLPDLWQVEQRDVPVEGKDEE